MKVEQYVYKNFSVESNRLTFSVGFLCKVKLKVFCQALEEENSLKKMWNFRDS